MSKAGEGEARMAATADSSVRPPLQDIARRLTAVRKWSGLNQTDFATRLGYPRRTYLSWERAEAPPPIWLLDGLKREFDVDPFWILHGPGDRVMRYGVGIDWNRLWKLQNEAKAANSLTGEALSEAHVFDVARLRFQELD